MRAQWILGLSILLVVAVACSTGDQGNRGDVDESLAKYGQEFKGKIAESYADSEEWWPSTPKPPAGTPNAIIFLLDDTGFGHLGSFGGLVETPHIDRLATNGLRYNNFHTTALCSPSRAAIMAGRNHHRIGLGSHSLTAMGFPGYNAFPPESGKSVAKHLQKAGFVNYAIGKWDHTPLYEVSESGPFDRWPSGEGFDHYYGFMAADADNYRSLVWRDHYPIEDWMDKPGYHYSETMADEAIRNITSHVSVSPGFNETYVLNGLQTPFDANMSHYEDWGGPSTYPHFHAGWALAGNTPFQYFKQIVHRGGIQDALVVHWPDGIKAKGEVRDQYHHIIDIGATIIDVTKTPFLEVLDGEEQMPLDGVSMAYSFDAPDAPTEHPEQYYELFGNRAIYQNGWKAVTIHAGRMPWDLNKVLPFENDVWELYHLDEDFSEAVNVADQYPEKLEELKARWEELAWENNVFPLYDDMIQRIAKQQSRLFGDRKEFVYYNPGARRIAEKASAPVKGLSHTIETTLNLTGKEEGVILACGGFTGGYTLFIKNNKVHYDYNYYHGLYYSMESSPLPRGEVNIKFVFTEDGGTTEGIPGGKGELYVNGNKADEVEMPEMHISTFSLSETFDVGVDAGTPVSNKYRVTNHYPYTGELDKVIVRLTD